MIRAILISLLLAAPASAGTTLVDKRAGWLILGNPGKQACSASIRAASLSGERAYLNVVWTPTGALKLEVIHPTAAAAPAARPYGQISFDDAPPRMLPLQQTADSFVLDIHPNRRAPKLAERLYSAARVVIALPAARDRVTVDTSDFDEVLVGVGECLTWLG